MESLPYLGSTSQFSRIRPGVIVKLPVEVWKGNPNHEKLEEENARAIAIERQILKKLSPHPRIVPFVCPFNHTVAASEVFSAAFWGSMTMAFCLAKQATGTCRRILTATMPQLTPLCVGNELCKRLKPLYIYTSMV